MGWFECSTMIHILIIMRLCIVSYQNFDSTRCVIIKFNLSLLLNNCVCSVCLFKFIHGLLCLPFLLLLHFLLLSSFIIIIIIIAFFFLVFNELVKIILMFFCNSPYFIFSWFQLNSLHQLYIR